MGTMHESNKGKKRFNTGRCNEEQIAIETEIRIQHNSTFVCQ